VASVPADTDTNEAVLPEADLPLKLVLATQSVASETLRPTPRLIDGREAPPKFAPSTVTLALPVAGVLAGATTVGSPSSNEKTALTVAGTAAAVAATVPRVHVVPRPLGDLACTEVLECHRVAAPPEPPATRTCGLPLTLPPPRPNKVTDNAPVAAALPVVTEDIAALSKLNGNTPVRRSVASDTLAGPTLPLPHAVLHPTDVDDCHGDASVPLGPVRACVVPCSKADTRTVTLMAPLAGALLDTPATDRES
jgi:hypothetical protein